MIINFNWIILNNNLIKWYNYLTTNYDLKLIITIIVTHYFYTQNSFIITQNFENKIVYL